MRRAWLYFLVSGLALCNGCKSDKSDKSGESYKIGQASPTQNLTTSINSSDPPPPPEIVIWVTPGLPHEPQEGYTLTVSWNPDVISGGGVSPPGSELNVTSGSCKWSGMPASVPMMFKLKILRKKDNTSPTLIKAEAASLDARSNLATWQVPESWPQQP